MNLWIVYSGQPEKWQNEASRLLRHRRWWYIRALYHQNRWKSNLADKCRKDIVAETYRESNCAVAAFPLLQFCRRGGLNKLRRSGWRTEMGKDNIWINSNKIYYSIVSLRAQFDVHVVDFSLSPPLLSHSCPAKARASERHWKRARAVRDRRQSRSVFRTPDTPSFAFAAVAQAKRSISLPLRPERSEKRTLGIRALFTIRAQRDGVSGVWKTERDKTSSRRLSHTVLARFLCLSLVLAFAGQEWDRSGGDSEKSTSCTPNRAANETILYSSKNIHFFICNCQFQKKASYVFRRIIAFINFITIGVLYFGDVPYWNCMLWICTLIIQNITSFNVQISIVSLTCFLTSLLNLSIFHYCYPPLRSARLWC